MTTKFPAVRSALPRYNAEAVDKAIRASKRSGHPISRKEAKLIHKLLKGRD